MYELLDDDVITRLGVFIYREAECVEPGKANFQKYLPDISILKEQLSEPLEELQYRDIENDLETCFAEKHKAYDRIVSGLNFLVQEETEAGLSVNRVSELYDLCRILGLCLTFEKAVEQGYPKLTKILSDEEFWTYMKSIQQDNFPAYTNLYDEEKFEKLGLHLFGKEIHIRSVSTSAADKHYKYLGNSYGELSTNSYLLIYAIVKYSKKFHINKLSSTYPYLEKVFGGSENNKLQDPVKEYFTYQNAINYMAEKKVPVKEMLTFCHYKELQSKMRLECEICKAYIAHDANSAYKDIFVEPNPLLVKYLVNSKTQIKQENIIFVFSTKLEAFIYHLTYPDIRSLFYEIDKKGMARYHEFAGGRQEDVIDVEIAELKPVQRIYYFARKDSVKYFYYVMSSLIPQLDEDCKNICMLTPNSVLNNKKNRTMLANTFPNWDINFLPGLFFKSKPKTQIWTVLRCNGERGKIYDEDIVNLHHLFFYTDFITGGLEQNGFLISEPFSVHLTKEEFTAKFGDKVLSLTDTFETYRPHPQKAGHRTQQYFHVTKEIIIWYSYSNGRGSYAYYGLPEDGGKISKLYRGKRLSKRIPFTWKNENNVQEHIEDLLLKRDDVIAALRSDIDKFYLKKEKGNEEEEKKISLKTYWIIRREALLTDHYYDEGKCIELFKSSYLSGIMSDEAGQIQPERVLREIGKTIGSKKKSTQMAYMRQIQRIMRYGNQEDLFKGETLTNFLSLNTKKREKLIQVRQSLQDKTFTAEEELKVLAYIRKKIKEGNLKFVAVAISFYCGLTADELAGLEWGDYVNLPGQKSHHYFAISHQRDRSDDRIHLFSVSEKQRFRKVPIAEELEDLLRLYRDETKAKHPKILESDPLIYDIHSTEEMKPCKYEEIKKVMDEADLVVHKETLENEITAFLGNKSNTKETLNLQKYFGNRFRVNFEYRMLQTAHMTMGEVNYILGRKQTDTYAKHYCDFSNEFVQLQLKKKIERWATGTKENMPSPIGFHTFSANGLIRNMNETPCRQEFDIKFGRAVDSEKDNVKACQDIELEITEPNGCDVLIVRRKK